MPEQRQIALTYQHKNRLKKPTNDQRSKVKDISKMKV